MNYADEHIRSKITILELNLVKYNFIILLYSINCDM